jgi:hypothetical protein
MLWRQAVCTSPSMKHFHSQFSVRRQQRWNRIPARKHILSGIVSAMSNTHLTIDAAPYLGWKKVTNSLVPDNTSSWSCHIIFVIVFLVSLLWSTCEAKPNLEQKKKATNSLPTVSSEIWDYTSSLSCHTIFLIAFLVSPFMINMWSQAQTGTKESNQQSTNCVEWITLSYHLPHFFHVWMFMINMWSQAKSGMKKESNKQYTDCVEWDLGLHIIIVLSYDCLLHFFSCLAFMVNMWSQTQSRNYVGCSSVLGEICCRWFLSSSIY